MNAKNVFLKILERFVKEQNENGTIEKKEQERNNLAEGRHSRTERNNFKKVGTCPSLLKTKTPVKEEFNSIFAI